MARAAHCKVGALESRVTDYKPPPPPPALLPNLKEGEEPPLEDKYAEPKLDAEVLENPARVVRAQERVIGPLPGSRYVPISAGRRAGIIVLKDTTPDEEEDLLAAVSLHAPDGSNADEEEPEPPAPFEFLG